MRDTPVFRTRVEPWFLSLVLLALMAAGLIALGPEERAPYVSLAVGSLVLLLALQYLGMRYRLERDRMVVVLGPVRLPFRYDEILQVRRGGWWDYLALLPRMRLATSHRNLVLELDRMLVRQLVISPADLEGFLEALRRRAPHIQVEV